MKNTLLAIIATTGALFAGADTAEAGGCQKPYIPPVVCPTPPPPPCPTPVYKIKTIQVHCCHHQMVGYDHCGHPFYYWVFIYTYKDIYSDGTFKLWKKTVRA